MLSTTNTQASVRLDNKLVATIAFSALFGSFLLYFVAFAHSEVLHNAGHDTRHAITVPCH